MDKATIKKFKNKKQNFDNREHKSWDSDFIFPVRAIGPELYLTLV